LTALLLQQCSVRTPKHSAKTRIPVASDKRLFTPGPQTTSMIVKQAMLRHLGSRDIEFISAVKEIREILLTLAKVSKERGMKRFLMQGSGTFGIEAVMTCTGPPNGKWLIIINGA